MDQVQRQGFRQSWRDEALDVKPDFAETTEEILGRLLSTLLLQALQVVQDLLYGGGLSHQEGTVQHRIVALGRNGIQHTAQAIAIQRLTNRKLCRVDWRGLLHWQERVGGVLIAAQVNQEYLGWLGVVYHVPWLAG